MIDPAPIREEIRSVWEADDRPWVMGFSGGKDSTCMVQLVWGAVAALPEARRRRKRLHVIASDTLVENPSVVRQMAESMSSMEEAARKAGLDLRTSLVRPRVTDAFWTCLLGRGMGAPTRNFRWCTERLKIDNANRYIRGVVSEAGQVVMALGTRKAESPLRRQTMEAHEIEGSVLSRHASLAGAFVYAPIRDLGVEDVWDILLMEKSPWGADNAALARMYRKANGGECPLVVDKASPSCGNSRFGCWTCTVVDEDLSLRRTVESGEAWMRPLLRYRNWLKSTHDPETWPEIRDYRRTNGQYKLRTKHRRPGLAPHLQLSPGPYLLAFRHRLTLALLGVERQLERSGHPMRLISDEEADEVQRWWRMRHGDWAGKMLEMFSAVGRGRGPLERAQSYSHRAGAIDECARERGVPGDFLRRLVSIVEESESPRQMRRELGYLADYDEREDLGEVVRDLRSRRGATDDAIQTAMGDFA